MFRYALQTAVIMLGLFGSGVVAVQLPAMNEVQWSAKLAEDVGGETEVRLPDGSRVDILTESNAWEVEWSDKWPEAIGQSVFYGMATDRRPGVWLLLRGKRDEDYLQCLMVCRKLGIELRTTETSQ